MKEATTPRRNFMVSRTYLRQTCRSLAKYFPEVAAWMEEEVKGWKPEYFTAEAVKARRLLRKAAGLPIMTPRPRVKRTAGKGKNTAARG